jgi:hypothetical protein
MLANGQGHVIRVPETGRILTSRLRGEVCCKTSKDIGLIVSTFRGWFQRSGLRRRGWRLGYPVLTLLRRLLSAQSRPDVESCCALG